MKTCTVKCPKCHQKMASARSSDCPVCSRLVRVVERTCCRYIFEKNKLDLIEIKQLLRNWPIALQEEFVRALAVFRINDPGRAN